MTMPGSNLPDSIDYAKDEVERLQGEYAETARAVDSLLEEFEDLPDEIADNAEKGIVASLIKRMRDTTKRIDGLRELEKMPYFRRGQGVDQFFNGLFDRLTRREKRNRPGAADVLQQRLTDYDTKLLLAEQERRRKEAAEAARIAREKQEAEARAAREAEERRLAAERARLPETRETKQEAAAAAEEVASAARIEAAVATDQAEAAYVDTLARPADIMRNRGADGTLTTMAREFYAEIEDAAKLDKNALWPFISLDAKEKALRQWAKNTGHRQQMPGAKIGDRPKSVVR
jgi:colicin import membrane protein